jgi:hypothetical protein
MATFWAIFFKNSSGHPDCQQQANSCNTSKTIVKTETITPAKTVTITTAKTETATAKTQTQQQQRQQQQKVTVTLQQQQKRFFVQKLKASVFLFFYHSNKSEAVLKFNF